MLFIQLGQRVIQETLYLVFVYQLLRRLPPIRNVFRVRDGAVAVLLLGRFLQRDRVQPLSLSDDL